MRRKVLLAIAGMSLGLTGCGTVQAAKETGAGAAETGGPPPIDAALVGSGFGWVLTADRLMVTTDLGVTFSDAKAPVPTTRARAAYFHDAQHGYVAAATGNAITVARTGDLGRTWRTTTVGRASAPAAEYGPLRMAFRDAGHGMILARTSPGAMASSATLWATRDGGKSWSARRAPAAGEIAMEPGGRVWLAGGVLGGELRYSDDQGRRWQTAVLNLRGRYDTRAVTPPAQGVLPVTVVTKADQTQVVLMTTADRGRTWNEAGRVTVRGRTGSGVRVPVAATASGPLVLDTAGGHAYRAPLGGPAASAMELRPQGLSEGAHTVSFASDGRTGWTMATYGRCAKGKTGCSLYHPLLATTDGGATWHQIRTWRQRLN